MKLSAKPNLLNTFISASLLVCLIAPLQAAIHKPAPGSNKTKSDVRKSVSGNKAVKKSRAKVRSTKRAMNNLADNIEANKASGGNWIGRPGTQNAINNAINAHGAAVRNHTRTVASSMATFIARNNINIIPEPPKAAPPPLPGTRAPANQARLATGTPANRTGGQLLTPPAAPPPTRRDKRPAGAASGQRLVNTRRPN